MASASSVAPTRAAGPWSPRQFQALTGLALAAAIFLRALVLLRGELSGEVLAAVGAVYLGDPDAPSSPIERLLTFVALALGPMDYWPIALALLVLWIGYCAAAWLACRALTPSPGIRLVLVVLAVFTPMAVPGMTAWPMGVQATSLAIGALLVIDGAARLHRSGRVRAAWTVTVGSAVAMAGSPSPLWAPAFLVLAWAIVLVCAPATAGIRQSASGPHRPPLGVCLGVLAPPVLLALAWVLGTRTVPWGPLPRDLGPIAGFVGEALGAGGLPALAGGPLAWTTGTQDWPAAQPSAWLVLLAAQVLLAGVVSSAFLASGRLSPWAIGVVFSVLSVTLFALSTPPVLSGTGAQLLGVSAIPAFLLVAASTSLHGVRIAEWAPGLRSGASGLLAFIVVDAFIALSVMTTIAWSDARGRYAGEDFISQATSDLSSADPAVPILGQVVSPEVVDPRLAPLNRSDVILAPTRPRPAFAAWTTELRAFDESGSLRPARLQGLPLVVECTSWTPALTLSQALPEFTYVLSIVLDEPSQDGFAVQLGNGPQAVVPPGIDSTTLYVQVTGSGSSVGVTPLGDDPLCPRSVTIGQVQPLSPGSSDREGESR